MEAAQMVQPASRPTTNGTTASRTSQSLSSFPTSRSTSGMSTLSRKLSKSVAQTRVDTSRAPDITSNTGTTRAPSIGGISSGHSQHSSLSAPPRYNPNAHSSRKLKSQYPRGETENHVEYILVASFDIDKGPVMEHQYPVAITGDEHMLAELMLPDQVHVRSQDWTMFFLHKDTNQDEEEAELKAERRARRLQRRQDIANGLPVEDDEDEEDGISDSEDEDVDLDEELGEGPPLIYVLNLVNNKKDSTVKRGAVVKAMAICTRHPFLHIYKPLLLLALDEYYKNPHLETLESLYTAVNTMDLSLMPKLSYLERHLLQSTENKDLFVEKFEQMIEMRMAEDRGELPTRQSQDLAHSPETRRDLTRIGTKAHVEGHGEYSVPRDTHEFETKVMYNGIPIPIKVPVASSPETVGDYSLIKLIQTFSEPHAKSPQPFSLHPHLTTGGAYTHPIIVLVNALVTQKRVIFLGYNRPSGEVAEAVLAAAAIASGGILRGFTRHAFPYTDLSKIEDLLKVPGFLAGVTNPTFETHDEWWDLLCDLPSGRMKISSKIDPAPPIEALRYFQQTPAAKEAWKEAVAACSSMGPINSDPTGDQAFMNDILRSVAARHGEGVIRAKWRDWVVKFARVAAVYERTIHETSALLYAEAGTAPFSLEGEDGFGYVWADEASKLRELAGGAHRIEGWRITRSYYHFLKDTEKLYALRPLKSLDLNHQHDRLRTQKLSPSASRSIYMALSKNLNSYDEICQLLAVAPESHAGLFYVALGLFHHEKEVRLAVADLLERVSEHEAGMHWWKSLSRFEKLAFMRIKREAEVEMKAAKEGELGRDASGARLGGWRGDSERSSK